MRHGLLAAVAAVVFGAASAHATTYTRTATGTVAGFTPISGLQPSPPPYLYTGADETLTGFADIPALVQGDEVDLTVTFDSTITIPASPSWTGFVLDLTGGAGGGGLDNFVFNFYDGATLVKTLTSYSTTNGDVSAFGILNPPDNTAFTFDSFTVDITATTLTTGPVDLNGAFFEWWDATNVPEPATWSLMLAGIGGLGGLLRRRRQGLLATA